MKRLSWSFFTTVTILLCSCVLSTEPIGQLSREIDLADWEGCGCMRKHSGSTPLLSRSGAGIE